MEKLKKIIITIAVILIVIVISIVILFVSIWFSSKYAKNLNNDERIYLNYSDERTLKYSDVEADGLYTLKIFVSAAKMLDQEFVVTDKDGTVIPKVGQYLKDIGSSLISNSLYDLKKGQKIRIKFKAVSSCSVTFEREIDHKNIVFGNAEAITLGSQIDYFNMTSYYKFTPTTTGAYTFESMAQKKITIFNTAHDKLKEVTTFPSSISMVGGIEYRIELPAYADMKITKAADNVEE